LRVYFEEISQVFNRFTWSDPDVTKLRKTNFMVAHAALAHKLARAAYYIMRDHVEFVPEKIFT